MDTTDELMTADELQKYSKEELIARMLSMQSHVRQLKNILNKRSGNSSDDKCRPRSERDFDFRKYKTRHIALKVLYLGWDYMGFAAQEDSHHTVEAALFEALTKTRLIRTRQTSNYHRCGRTDKGVSAFSQIISLDVRTNLKSGKGVITPEDYVDHSDGQTDESDPEEINYALILNNVLPEDIRVICWTPVETEFSSRFDCKSRTYKYLFPKGGLDIDRMRVGCDYLVGDHDFRNFCKMDVNNGVTNYRRNILSIHLQQYSTESNCNHFGCDENYSMYSLTITGTAFIWHQIRCIVALLFLVGQHREEPEIISQLLDVDRHPNKPQYCMATDFPLILFDCSYSGNDINEWIFDTKASVQLIKHLQSLWTKQMIKTDVIKLMLNSLTNDFKARNTCEDLSDNSSLIDALCMGVRHKVYKPLLQRPVCESLEQRISKCNKRTKIKD
ncbi:unnamed protein product [Oppiella nova]|uniref:Pseudouridine synthase I TruA alpha/beta domain-containing protein n=1 Tax=Oppiella nova TaxID=334625 RepID=A0A7R9LC60_9ACAR|nr:unnamed protein product [Oppiella nova]CAG2162043.1 unnamed protein product [Oppiella nova]